MKKRYKNVFDKERRDLLKIFAAAGVTKGLLRASPLVWGTMYSRLAHAQQVNKSLIIYVPDGCIPDQWFPNANLSQLKPMSQPYNGIKNQCHFLKNMSHHRGGHGVVSTVINNNFQGDSFDVNMGRTIGQNRPFSYINLGVHSNGHGELTRASGVAVPSEDNPFNAFNRLFNADPTSSSDPKFRIIDSHRDAVNALKNKLGTYEQQRLDSHLTAVAETEQRLIDLANSGGGSQTCDAAGPAPTPFPLNHSTFQQQAELQADIIALAFKCNLTSSASLMLGNHQGEFSFPYLNYTGVYHQSIHGGNNGDSSYPHFRETRGHLSSLSAYAINKLQQEGLLDSTIVCEVTDMGNGDAHSSNDVPLIIAGGGNAVVRGVSTAGGETYTPLNLLHTAAVALNAHQDPNYKGYASNVIPGLLT